MAEEWLEIKGFEGLYKVSSRGRIKSLPRMGTSGKVLSPNMRGDYYSISLSNHNTYKSYPIAQLVAEAFIPKPSSSSRLEVNHKDGNKLNNRKSNLEWTDASGNAYHAFDLGLRRRATKHEQSKFTEDQIRMIRKSKKADLILAIKYSVSRQTIYNIKMFRTYSSVL